MSRKTNFDPFTYSAELDWWLTMRDSACGFRSSLGGFIATCERGGVHGLPSSDRYNTEQCDVGPAAFGAFARDRKMARRWTQLFAGTKAVLIAYYLLSSPQECGESVHDPKTGKVLFVARRRFPLGFEPQFEKFAGVVMYQSDPVTLEKLLKAAQHAAEKKFENRPNGKLEAARARAEKAVRVAHAAYYELCKAEDEDGVIEEEVMLARSWIPEDLDEELRELGSGPVSARRCSDGVWRAA